MSGFCRKTSHFNPDDPAIQKGIEDLVDSNRIGRRWQLARLIVRRGATNRHDRLTLTVPGQQSIELNHRFSHILTTSNFQSNVSMDSELTDRSQAILQRITQLRDSL